MIPHAFGRRPPPSVGIEEELFVVDGETLAPAPFPTELLDGSHLKAELFTTMIELATGVKQSVTEAVEELERLRQEARRLAAARGLLLAAAGTWPLARPEDQPIGVDERFHRFVRYAGSSARRQFCCGLHVHVGVESPRRCLAALEAVLPWLPVVLALAANSPYLAAAATGLASTRAEVLGLLPRAGAPPVYASYAEWERFVERLVTLGLADSYASIWWDVRPHPRLGTLELRIADQPTRIATTAAVSALLQALVELEEPGRPSDRGIYAQNRWAALRFGHEAELVHPDGSRLGTVEQLLEELLTRIEPAVARQGNAKLLGPLTGLAQARDQLALGGKEGLRRLCRRLVELT